jgi:hypothetical protein
MKYSTGFCMLFSGASFLFSSCGNQINSQQQATNDSVRQEIKDTMQVATVPAEDIPLWKELPKDAFKGMDTGNVHYKNYKLFAMDSLKMQTMLLKAPKENQRKIDSLKLIISLPKPDGSFADFSMYSTSVMDPALEAKFPMLKTYAGKGVKDPSSSVRLEFNQNGFSAYVFGTEGEWLVQPAAQGITHQFLVCFYKQDAINKNGKPFELSGSPVR